MSTQILEKDASNRGNVSNDVVANRDPSSETPSTQAETIELFYTFEAHFAKPMFLTAVCLTISFDKFQRHSVTTP